MPMKKKDEVVNEIDAMLGAFDQPVEEESKEPEEEGSEEPTEEEEAGEKEDSSEEESGEEEKDDSEEEEESTEEEDPADETGKPKDDEPDEKDGIIADLREKLAKSKEPDEEDDEEEKEEEKEEEPLTLEAQDFIGDLDIDEVLGSKEGINELLNLVYSKGMTDSRSAVGEHVLRGIPDIVKSNMIIMGKLEKARDKFYENNPDLEPFKKVVAAVFTEVDAANPDKGYEELLVEVGKETRKRLDLHKKALEPDDDTLGKPPKLPKKKSSRTSKDEPDVSGLEGELSDMNKAVRR